jgi:hypothetical protein
VVNASERGIVDERLAHLVPGVTSARSSPFAYVSLIIDCFFRRSNRKCCLDWPLPKRERLPFSKTFIASTDAKRRPLDAGP